MFAAGCGGPYGRCDFHQTGVIAAFRVSCKCLLQLPPNASARAFTYTTWMFYCWQRGYILIWYPGFFAHQVTEKLDFGYAFDVVYALVSTRTRLAATVSRLTIASNYRQSSINMWVIVGRDARPSTGLYHANNIAIQQTNEKIAFAQRSQILWLTHIVSHLLSASCIRGVRLMFPHRRPTALGWHKVQSADTAAEYMLHSCRHVTTMT